MQVKVKISAFSLLLLFSCHLFAYAQTERRIAEIRAEVAAIDKAAFQYTKKTKDVADVSLEGTEADYFVSGKGIKKIVARMYGETYRATGEFYYSGESLIFAFVKFNRYDTQIGMNPPPRIARTEEQRFYFAGGNLIRLLLGKKEIAPGEERYAELKEEIVGISDALKKSY